MEDLGKFLQKDSDLSTRFLEKVLKRLPKDIKVPIKGVEIYYLEEDLRYLIYLMLKVLGLKIIY